MSNECVIEEKGDCFLLSARQEETEKIRSLLKRTMKKALLPKES
jgi:hypothetical protein